MESQGVRQVGKIASNFNVGDKENLTPELLLELMEKMYRDLAEAVNGKPDVFERTTDGQTSDTILSNGSFNINSTTQKVEILTEHSGSSVTWTDISHPSIPPTPLIQKVYVSDNSNFSTATVIPADDTIPQNTEGAELFTLNITPSNAASILYFDINLTIWSTLGNSLGTAALFQDSQASAISASGIWNHQQLGFFPLTIAFRHRMIAGTTATTTFKVRVGSNIGSTYVNGSSVSRFLGGAMAATMIITEISA